MDVYNITKHKKTIRAATWLLRKKLGECALEENVHNDLLNSGNPAIQFFAQLLTYAGDSIKEKYQSKTVKSLGELLIWIIYKDTAYRDMFFWVIDQILQKAEEIRIWIKPYVKEPKDWYPNVWHVTKKHTEQLRKDNKIPPYMKSLDEKIFTPAEQERALQRYK